MGPLIASVLFFLFLFSGLGCSLPERPDLVSISNPALFKPKNPAEIKSVEDAMAAVITVTSKELGLPVVEPLYLHLYKNSDAFAAYSSVYGGRLPHDVAGFAIAVAQENRFHLNMEKIGGVPWSGLIRILAHEYTHNVQYLLTGSQRRGAQWIREGFAEWVAVKVMHSLGWQDYGEVFHRAKVEVSRHSRLLPALSELEENSSWLKWANQQKGAIVTYGLAFVAVDRLIAKTGVSGIVKYFGSEEFKSSFGLSTDDFDTELRRTFLEAPRGVQKDLQASRPEWKIGHKWQYSWRASGRSGTITKEIVGADNFQGVPSYVLKGGRNEYIYTKDSLGLLATISNGKVVIKRNPPYRLLAWPLEIGKEWKNSFVRENADYESSQTLDYQMVVAGVEEVRVPAGTLSAFKIVVYGSNSGNLLAEHWYSPQVKWFVKERIYLPDGVREEELISYQID